METVSNKKADTADLEQKKRKCTAISLFTLKVNIISGPGTCRKPGYEKAIPTRYRNIRLVKAKKQT